MGLETRNYKNDCEVRQGMNGPMIVGYASVFNRDSSDMGFIEQVDPSAFDKTLQTSDVRGLVNHDPSWLIGRTKAGTMRLSTDNVGLRYEIDINPNDPDGQRALAKVQRGDLDGSSFSFNTIRDSWNWATSPPQRRLLEVGLIDAGPVSYPAYPDSTAAARALEPIAAKTGHTVDKLLAAMRSGEIRSLIDGGSTMTDEQRAVWSTAFQNDLPDSSFLYIEDGGTKDSDGKTVPRTLRHFPYKDGSGKVDLPHLRNALARIPDSDLPASVKDELTAKAQKILAAQNGKNSLTFEEFEQRVGKVISAATAARIEGAINGLRELLDGSTVDGDADDDTLVGQALEMDSVPMAKEKDDNTPAPLFVGAGRAILAEMEQRVLQDIAA